MNSSANQTDEEADADAVERLSGAVARTRSIPEQIGEIAIAGQIWRAAARDEALAERWITATRGDSRIAERLAGLGLEPEQLYRLIERVPDLRPTEVADRLDDESLLLALAAQGEPSWCTCGWRDWQDTETGWQCPHCRATVRRDPR